LAASKAMTVPAAATTTKVTATRRATVGRRAR
jgi:hypothetical protein